MENQSQPRSASGSSGTGATSRSCAAEARARRGGWRAARGRSRDERPPASRSSSSYHGVGRRRRRGRPPPARRLARSASRRSSATSSAAATGFTTAGRLSPERASAAGNGRPHLRRRIRGLARPRPARARGASAPGVLLPLHGVVGRAPSTRARETQGGCSTRPGRGSSHAAGMELGSHTETHPDLRRLGDEELRRELGGLEGERSRRSPASRAGPSPTPTASPTSVCAAAARDAGYELALGWQPGPWHAFDVPRLPAPPRHGAGRLALKLLGVAAPKEVGVRFSVVIPTFRRKDDPAGDARAGLHAPSRRPTRSLDRGRGRLRRGARPRRASSVRSSRRRASATSTRSRASRVSETSGSSEAQRRRASSSSTTTSRSRRTSSPGSRRPTRTRTSSARPATSSSPSPAGSAGPATRSAGSSSAARTGRSPRSATRATSRDVADAARRRVDGRLLHDRPPRRCCARALRRDPGRLRARRGRGLLVPAVAARARLLPPARRRAPRQARLHVEGPARLQPPRRPEPRPTSSARTSTAGR